MGLVSTRDARRERGAPPTSMSLFNAAAKLHYCICHSSTSTGERFCDGGQRSEKKGNQDGDRLRFATSMAALPLRWNVFTLQLGSISCGAAGSQLPAARCSSPNALSGVRGRKARRCPWWKFSDAAAALTESCHGNSLSEAEGTEMFFISLRYTNKAGKSVRLLKCCPTAALLHLDLLSLGREHKHR